MPRRLCSWDVGHGGRGRGAMRALDVSVFDKTFPSLDGKANSQIKMLWITCGTAASLIGVNRQFKDWLKAKNVKFTEGKPLTWDTSGPFGERISPSSRRRHFSRVESGVFATRVSAANEPPERSGARGPASDGVRGSGGRSPPVKKAQRSTVNSRSACLRPGIGSWVGLLEGDASATTWCRRDREC